MKISNCSIIQEFRFPDTIARNVAIEYDLKQKQDSERWCSLIQLPEGIREQMNSLAVLQGFAAKIVSYSIPCNSHCGLDRRHAIKILTKLGLQQPSTFQVLQMAADYRSCFELENIIKENEERDVVACTPFHPESPEYLFFQLYCNKISFSGRVYCRMSGKNNLYFAEHFPTYNQVRKSWFIYNHKHYFPLLIGVVSI